MAQKFASYVNNGTDQINFVGNTYFVKGTQTASTNAWTGALPGNLQAYYDGLTIDYFLPYAGTSTAATLDLSSKGAKPVYYRGTGGVTTHYPANSVIHLTYVASLNSGNGAWESSAWYDSNSTYSNASLGQGYGTCTTAAATVAKVVTLSGYSLSTGGIVSIKFSNDVPANATLNVNSRGAKPIYYNSLPISSGIINVGNTATFMYDGSKYHLLTVDSSAIEDEVSGITLTLYASEWNNNLYTLSDSRFKKAGYAYVASPISANFAAWSSAFIIPQNVTTDGIMNFTCEITPSQDITVSIVSYRTGYKSNVLTGTISTTDWSNNQATLDIQDLSASGYVYQISPQPDSNAIWNESMIYANDITTDNSITFRCSTTPTANVHFIILKQAVS